MTDLLKETVPRMPPLAMSMIEEVGEKTLKLLCPEALERPTAIDFLHLVEKKLPEYGIFVYPATADELDDRLAATDPSGTREITILLCDELWQHLMIGGRQANRARATIAHELSHAILHVPVVRRRMASPLSALLMNRVRRDTLRPFEDPEWQAWALGGCLIAPRKTLEMLPEGSSMTDVASAFGVSEGMAKSHVKRLKLTGRFSGI